MARPFRTTGFRLSLLERIINKSIVVPIAAAVVGLGFGALVGGTGGFFAGRASVKTTTSATAQSSVPTTKSDSLPEQADPKIVRRKTYTRKELEAWLHGKKDEDLKAHLGKPDSTQMVKGVPYKTGSKDPIMATGRTDHLVYYYDGLSVDADGSGKIDRRTVIYLDEYEHRFAKIEFIP